MLMPLKQELIRNVLLQIQIFFFKVLQLSNLFLITLFQPKDKDQLNAANNYTIQETKINYLKYNFYK